MKDLNNLEEIKKLDPKNVFGSTQMLYDQCWQIWQDVKDLNITATVENIIICGMGGSAYGGHVLKSMFDETLGKPLLVINDYNLPAFAGENTLVVLTSYSGTTEETLSCARKAKEKGCQIVVLTSGGSLEKLVKEENYQGLVFDPKHNPSGQPRLGTGYIVLGTIAIFNKLGFITVEDNKLAEALEFLRKENENIMENAKTLAIKIQGKIPLIIAAEFLEGNSHIIRNQINETAKSFSDFAVLPELNHHLMEGLKNPADRKLVCLFFSSPLYSQNIKKRLMLTKEVVKKNGVEAIEYNVKGEDKISQMLEVLSFGAFLSFYLAILYDQDPSVIPWVDYFKEQLHSAE